jgi:hypothetical protein
MTDQKRIAVFRERIVSLVYFDFNNNDHERVEMEIEV